ncbi:unnamed protein product [Notodromas monacha]|uniref:NADH:ubiquinone oxidoreductase intermediate-associated protein 30 domain-containing protein n=1 Tax=Notodromas monacha TaxID=399045 RepID=A0A7R9BT50_9CRUS|nr:unnamed protein product [Notodromas monacha]CAG0919820.1 unnamed protein product [Notodromas monacha]
MSAGVLAYFTVWVILISNPYTAVGITHKRLMLNQTASRFSSSKDASSVQYFQDLLNHLNVSALSKVFGLDNRMWQHEQTHKLLFDFRYADDLQNWVEFSDTMHHLGNSKAVLTLIRTRKSQRGVLFTLLNEKDNAGTSFAGVQMKLTPQDLSTFTGIQLRVRVQGQYSRLKVILRNDVDPFYPQFELFKSLPPNGLDMVDLHYPFCHFQPYVRRVGPLDGLVSLDLTNIIDITLTAFGGVFLGTRNIGSAAFEIEWISVYRESPPFIPQGSHMSSIRSENPLDNFRHNNIH